MALAKKAVKPVPTNLTPSDKRLRLAQDLRNRLSLMFRTALTATAAMLAFGLIDSAGQTLYALAVSRNLHPTRGSAACSER